VEIGTSAARAVKAPNENGVLPAEKIRTGIEAVAAMMNMVKIDVAELKRAWD